MAHVNNNINIQYLMVKIIFNIIMVPMCHARVTVPTIDYLFLLSIKLLILGKKFNKLKQTLKMLLYKMHYPLIVYRCLLLFTQQNVF